MLTASRHDAWQAGDSYEAYMGRWSRQVAPRFVEWLGVAAGRDWLEIGCGTGALTAAIVAGANPRSLVSIDSSDGFLATAHARIDDSRVTFRAGDAQALPFEPGSRDAVASALVLNFIPDRLKALGEMKRVTRSGGTVGFYVWDYPGGGVEFMRAFWTAAASLDPAAKELTEDRRFPYCTPTGLTELMHDAGLPAAECSAIEVPTDFPSFEDFWRPFTLGAGPAPGYCASLSDAARLRLRDKLQRSAPVRPDGTIAMTARAWAVKATVS